MGKVVPSGDGAPARKPPTKGPASPRRPRPSPLALAHERGLAAERRVLVVCSSPRRPSWLLSARRASRAEDRAGIDVVLETDVGRLYLQVKSSRAGMAGFLERKRRRPRIAIVVVRRLDSNEAVLRRVVMAVGEVRGLYLAERRPPV